MVRFLPETMKSLALGGVVTAGILVALTPASLYAQQQPAEATNAQDEYVHIDSPKPGDDGILTIFRSDDKQTVSRYATEVIELKNAVAYELLPHVLKAVKLEGGTARTLKYKDPETGKTRYFMQVVTTERQMPTVIEMLRQIDLPDVVSSKGDKKYAIRMKYRKASEVAEILENTQLSGEGDVYADDISNTLWFADSVSDSMGDLAYVDFYDVPTPQIEFDVQVIELPEADSSRLGLDWDAWKRSLSGDVEVDYNWQDARNSASAWQANVAAMLNLDAATLVNFLNYTTTTGSSKVIKRAKVTADNLESANIESVTRRYPIFGTGENKDKTYHGDEKLYINIKPTIGTEMVKAKINVEVDTITALDEYNKPIVNEQNFNTIVTLEDGSTVCVGSIDCVYEDERVRGIPGLKDIPVLKWLFSVREKRAESSKVFIIATPKFSNALKYGVRINTEEGDILTQNPAKPELSVSVIENMLTD